MNILVTGATGFVGRHVVRRLAETSHQIVTTSLEPSPFGSYPNVRHIVADLDDAAMDFFELFHEPKLVIHLAWGNVSNVGSLTHIEKEIAVHYRFLKSMVLAGLGDILATGTCLEYGKQQGCLFEELPSIPTVSYAIAKNTLRLFLEELKKHRFFLLKWVRPFYVFGEDQPDHTLFGQLREAVARGDQVFNMSGGEQLRDYLHVDRMAEYIVDIALQDRVTGIINCCSGIPVSVRRFVEQRIASQGKSLSLNLGHYPYAEYEPMAFWGDTTKMKTALGRDFRN